MQVEQIDREAAEEWRMDLDPGMRSVLAVSFARHRITERERVVGEIVEWLREGIVIRDDGRGTTITRTTEAERAAADLIETQAREIERLRAALRFYADENNPHPNDGPWGVNSSDFGDTARAALGYSHDQ